MKSYTKIVGCLFGCVIIGAIIWRFTPGLGAGRQDSVSSSTVPLPTIDAPKANADGLAVERDHAAVFQRAFWRRPGKDDRILHAERRDWVDASDRVEKWQWFIAMQPSAAFRDWLLNENPFELVTVAHDAPLGPLSSPPAWFPAAAELALFPGYRNREGRYLIFFDTANNKLFATDSGGGLSAPSK